MSGTRVVSGTRVIEYTWVGRIEIEVGQSGDEGDQEALDVFNDMLTKKEFTHIMDLELEDEGPEVVDGHDDEEEE